MNKSHVFFLIHKNTKLQDLKDFFDLNYDNNMFQDNLGDNFKLIDTYNYLYTHPSNGNTRKYIYSLFKRK